MPAQLGPSHLSGQSAAVITAGSCVDRGAGRGRVGAGWGVGGTRVHRSVPGESFTRTPPYQLT